jgi:hypothetical protein
MHLGMTTHSKSGLNACRVGQVCDPSGYENRVTDLDACLDQKHQGKGVDRPSRESGDNDTTPESDLPAEEIRTDAVKATAVLHAHSQYFM